MVICPKCGSTDVGVANLFGQLYWVRCRGCGSGWETGRWRPFFSEEGNDLLGGTSLAAQAAGRRQVQPATEIGEW
jgi:hypothetical protein